MSLDFSGGSTHRVECGSGASLDNVNVGTTLAWIRWTGASNTTGRICQKATGSGFKLFQLRFISGTWGLHMGRGGGTVKETSFSQFPTWGTGKWIMAGCSWNDNSTNTAVQHLYMGDETTAAAEPTTYDKTDTAGGAPVDDSAGDFAIGGIPGGGGTNFLGLIGYLAHFNVQLSLTDINIWRLNPQPLSGCVGFWRLGGTGTQTDLSGNGNDGTITGATDSALFPAVGQPAMRRFGRAPRGLQGVRIY